MDLSDVKVTDEDGFLSRNNTIKANNKIVKERIWTGLVTSKIETQLLGTDTDAQLHDERIITVREEPSLHVESIGRLCAPIQGVEDCNVRVSKKSGWNIVSRLASTEKLAGMDILCSDKTGTRTQSIMTIESRLPWCETSEQGLLSFCSTEWCSAR